LSLTFEDNLYCPGPGQELFHWGVPWKGHKRYDNLDKVRQELSLDQHSEVVEFHVKDSAGFDLRVPADSPAVKMDCYPRGAIPDVRLGPLPQGSSVRSPPYR
jgi:hypothetical protein